MVIKVLETFRKGTHKRLTGTEMWSIGIELKSFWGSRRRRWGCRMLHKLADVFLVIQERSKRSMRIKEDDEVASWLHDVKFPGVKGDMPSANAAKSGIAH